MHSSNSRAVHFAPPAGGLLNAQGAQGRPLHTSPAKFLCIFLSCCYFETTRFLSFGLFLRSDIILRLGGEEGVVEPLFFCHQGSVGTFLHYLALVKYGDLIAELA